MLQTDNICDANVTISYPGRPPLWCISAL